MEEKEKDTSVERSKAEDDKHEDVNAFYERVEKWMSTYFKKSEVAIRNTTEECWVIIRGIVRDLTPIVRKYINRKSVLPILAEAGKDITHWFDEEGEFLRFVHPVSKEYMPYLPHGPVPHLCDNHLPSPFWYPTPPLPWWRDKRLFVGRITANERPVRIRNMLTKQEARFTVCEEDKISDGIVSRYKMYNSAYNSYVWKFEGRPVDMDKTLSANGIEDLRPAMREVRIPECIYIPCLDLYYKDDFL